MLNRSEKEEILGKGGVLKLTDKEKMVVVEDAERSAESVFFCRQSAYEVPHGYAFVVLRRSRHRCDDRAGGLLEGLRGDEDAGAMLWLHREAQLVLGRALHAVGSQMATQGSSLHRKNALTALAM